MQTGAPPVNSCTTPSLVALTTQATPGQSNIVPAQTGQVPMTQPTDTQQAQSLARPNLLIPNRFRILLDNR